MTERTDEIFAALRKSAPFLLGEHILVGRTSEGNPFLRDQMLPLPYDRAVELLHQMLDFYEQFTPEEWERVIVFVERDKQKRYTARINKPSSKPKAGYVYLIKEVNGAHYKIGLSNKPQDRFHTFGITLPFKVEPVCIIPTQDMQRLEETLHAQFADKNAGGEWFLLTPDDVEYIKGLAHEQ